MAGISGPAVGVAAAGGLLIYAGINGISIRDALADITSGRGPEWRKGQSLTAGVSAAAASVAPGAGPFPDLVTAALRHRTEQYSQAKRWQDGYSDCSSFVGKSFIDASIKPPGTSVTGSYLAWSKLTTVKRAEIGAGDLLCGANHIAIAIDNATAIGQQRPGRNVQIGAIDQIMYGQNGWIPRRYTGSKPHTGVRAQ